MSIREWLGRVEDRRRAERCQPEDLVAFYWTGSFPSPKPVLDIGYYGAHVSAPAGFYAGTLVQMVLVDRAAGRQHAEVGHHICVCARVLRNVPDGFCVEFSFGDAAERRQFRLFVNRLKRRTKDESATKEKAASEGSSAD